MENHLYHNVLKIETLLSILESGKILKDERILNPCVCLSRDKKYLSSRGIQIVIDLNRLKSYAKLKPFCYHGWKRVNKIPSRLKEIDEFEERCYSDVILSKCCVCIIIDRKIHPTLEINHPLIVNNFIK